MQDDLAAQAVVGVGESTAGLTALDQPGHPRSCTQRARPAVDLALRIRSTMPVLAGADDLEAISVKSVPPPSRPVTNASSIFIGPPSLTDTTVHNWTRPAVPRLQ